ncbi:uncharacterized protein BO66DRAFT_219559 [Aspergillus aculeatinus CBS 121060]|uniref:Uncharacterized protein n=1 Tax=Aspergillus aculeatinus CBS 121060 TaxID=1448322 RepID=A0ACD1GUM2_9EURO|nr:hypothetical protein BO66DRAFT_219559 [Aspergillus aculeatinus CBS 121060]RAH65047.1 hypothetical protein BO66DRAFT_219559 [Aspergillus aculeatinus CBS 121060]
MALKILPGRHSFLSRRVNLQVRRGRGGGFQITAQTAEFILSDPGEPPRPRYQPRGAFLRRLYRPPPCPCPTYHRSCDPCDKLTSALRQFTMRSMNHIQCIWYCFIVKRSMDRRFQSHVLLRQCDCDIHSSGPNWGCTPLLLLPPQTPRGWGYLRSTELPRRLGAWMCSDFPDIHPNYEF